MEIKKREKRKYSLDLKKVLGIIKKGIFNKATKIIFFTLFIFIFFILGLGAGLFASGYLGTFDNPSQNAIDLLHTFGIIGLKNFKDKVDMIKGENIKIPFNYVEGKFSNPEKIYLDIDFEDYQKLEYARALALEKGIITEAEEIYVPAKIRYGSENINVKLRLKGDFTDHISGDKWSFRIKIKDEKNLFGMRVFSIQAPETRGYVDTLIFYSAMKNEGIISPRINFIEVIVNGKNKGIYNIEEHFSKEMIAYNNRREGFIFKIDEGDLFEDMINSVNTFSSTQEWLNYSAEKENELFYYDEIDIFDDKILEDNSLSVQFNEARNLVEGFRQGKLKTSEVFDTEILAKYFATATLLGAWHGAKWNNIRFYYNPITLKVEPVAYDGDITDGASGLMDEFFSNCIITQDKTCSEDNGFFKLIFSDPVFFEKYIHELERMSKEEYVDELFSEFNYEIEEDTKIIHKNYPTYRFNKQTIYSNAREIRFKLNKSENLKIYLNGSSEFEINLSIKNLKNMPFEIIGISYEGETISGPQNKKIIQPDSGFENFEFNLNKRFDYNENSSIKLIYKIPGGEATKEDKISPFVYIEIDSGNFEQNFSEEDFLDVNKNAKIIKIKKGNWVLEKDFVFPEGYRIIFELGTKINLLENATIISYSPLQILGTKEETIEIFSEDKTGKVIVLNAKEISNFKNVVINDLGVSKDKERITGGITFYNSPVNIKNTYISGFNSEDTFDFVLSEYAIEDSIIKNCYSDCIDDDFGGGTIINTKFENCGNDCIDISGANSSIKDITINKVGDKGISAGEKSNLELENIKINNAYIGIASKDNSNVNANNVLINGSKYCIAIYQKKPEFGPASIIAKKIIFNSCEEDYVVEKSSKLNLEGELIIQGGKKIYEKLYGEK